MGSSILQNATPNLEYIFSEVKQDAFYKLCETKVKLKKSFQ
jgi:hypothetical protein